MKARTASGVLALLMGLVLLVFAGATPASADPPGFNGTVKIHEGATEAEPVMRNEPHVCTFHIHGFNFDAAAVGTWRIEGWPPTGGPTTSGSWGPANTSGEWRSGVMTLPDGHYKLFFDQTAPAAPGGTKQKVFWVDCAHQQSSEAEAAQSALSTSISTAQGVAAQLSAAITSAGQLTSQQRAAISPAMQAAITANANLAARLTEAQSALASLNAAISSGNAAQTTAAITAAQQAAANLNVAISAGASANTALNTALTAQLSLAGTVSATVPASSMGAEASSAARAPSAGAEVRTAVGTSAAAGAPGTVAGVETQPMGRSTTVAPTGPSLTSTASSTPGGGPVSVAGVQRAGPQTLPSTSTAAYTNDTLALAGAGLVLMLIGLLVSRPRRNTATH